jgi:mono/diheme cytochrome c family protein
MLKSSSLAVLGAFVLPAAAADYRRDIRPILEKHCYECHSEKAKKEKAGYVFDNLERFGNDIDPRGIVVPGDPSRSRLFEVITMTGDNQMPPNGPRVSPKEIKLLREWIEEGAALDAATAKTGGGAAKSGLAPRPAAAPAPVQDWTSRDGKTIKARFVRLKEDAVVIRTADGKFFKVPLSRLADASQEQAKKAAAEAEPSGNP